MKVIKPPRSILKHKVGNLLVFLAGTIDMGNSEDWQSRVEEYFEEYRDITLLNPRRDDWDPTWKQEFENPHFYQQVNWELRGLELADKIIMYLDPDSKSPISLLELGLYAKSEKLLVCCPEGFWRKGNVDIMCENFNIPLYNDLNVLLSENFGKS